MAKELADAAGPVVHQRCGLQETWVEVSLNSVEISKGDRIALSTHSCLWSLAGSACPSKPRHAVADRDRYDDLIPEENDIVQTAIKRLPPKEAYDRIFRIRRAFQVRSIKIYVGDDSDFRLE